MIWMAEKARCITCLVGDYNTLMFCLSEAFSAFKDLSLLRSSMLVTWLVMIPVKILCSVVLSSLPSLSMSLNLFCIKFLKTILLK